MSYTHFCIALVLTGSTSCISVLLWQKVSETTSTTLFPVALFSTIAASTGFIISFYMGYNVCQNILIKKQNRINSSSQVDYNTL